MAFDYETKDMGGSGISVPINSVSADSVSAPTADYTFWMRLTDLPRTLLQGTVAMKLAGKKYLPQNPLESGGAYQLRLELSILLNAYNKTCSFLSGQVFQSDMIFADDAPEQIVEWSRKIDTKGNDINVFSKRLLQHGLGKGVAIIYVDAPKQSGETITVEDEKTNNIRPYFKEIEPESVIGWRVDEVTGELTQIRFLETIVRPVGKYGYKNVTCVRVLEKGRWEVHELDGDGTVTAVEEGELGIDVIPISIYIPGNEISVLTGKPPMMDLAELNLGHWRSNSDQINILHVARVPILFGINIDVNQMPVGTAAMITSTDESAKLEYVEITGKAIESGRDELKDFEAQMALYGLQQLIPRSGNMTATEKAITSSESNSSLSTWATEFESCLQHALEIMAMFGGAEFPADSVSVNKEFMIGIADPQEIQALLNAQDQGIISAQACFTELRRRGVLDEHISWGDMEADIEKEKQEAIEMASLSGSAFGGEGGDTEDNKEDNKEDDK